MNGRDVGTAEIALEKQLQLLFERSKNCNDCADLVDMSDAMVRIGKLLMSQNPDRKPYVPLERV